MEFHGRAMNWWEYADPDRLKAEIDHLIETVDPEVLAAHGLFIRETLAKYMKRCMEVVDTIAVGGDIGTLT